MRSVFISLSLLVVDYQSVFANEINLSGTYILQDSCDFFQQEYNQKGELESEKREKEDYLAVPDFKNIKGESRIGLLHREVPRNNSIQITQFGKQHFRAEYTDKWNKNSILEIAPFSSKYETIEIDSDENTLNVHYVSTAPFSFLTADKSEGNWSFSKIQNGLLVSYQYLSNFSYLYMNMKRSGQCILYLNKTQD